MGVDDEGGIKEDPSELVGTAEPSSFFLFLRSEEVPMMPYSTVG